MEAEPFIELLEQNAIHAERCGNEQFDSVQNRQSPEFVTVCCSDSRVLQDRMFENREPGRIFTCGNIGNRVFQETNEGLAVSGDLIYPVAHTGTRNVVVIGHTGCGAVTAVYESVVNEAGEEEPAGIRHCVDLLKSELAVGIEQLPDGLGKSEAVNHLVEYNVDRQVAFLRESAEVPDDVDLLGVVYDFQDVYSEERGMVNVVNVNGVREQERIEAPEIAERLNRLWTY